MSLPHSNSVSLCAKASNRARGFANQSCSCSVEEHVKFVSLIVKSTGCSPEIPVSRNGSPASSRPASSRSFHTPRPIRYYNYTNRENSFPPVHQPRNRIDNRTRWLIPSIWYLKVMADNNCCAMLVLLILYE